MTVCLESNIPLMLINSEYNKQILFRKNAANWEKRKTMYISQKVM